MTTMKPIRCDCGGHYYRDANGRAVCEACRAVVTFEALLAIGLRPVWDMDRGARLATLAD